MKPKKRQPPAPTVLNRSARLQIFAAVILSLLVLFGGAFFRAKSKHSQHIESTVARWRVTYHLDDDQVRQIRGLETQFHAGWNPFNHPVHTPAETYRHHLAISRVMAPEDAAYFLKNTEGARSATDPER